MLLVGAGAVGASMAPVTAVGADSQADAAFFFSSNIFNPFCNAAFTSFCFPSGIVRTSCLKVQPDLQAPNKPNVVQRPLEPISKSWRGIPVSATNFGIVIVGWSARIFFTVAEHKAGMLGFTVA